MDLLLLLFVAVPFVGGVTAAMAGASDRWRNRLLREAGLAAALICAAMMGAVLYRRFYLPLGAAQLVIERGSWFASPPLTAQFALRMDTVSGVLCGIAIALGFLVQLMHLIRKTDARIRAAHSGLLAATLLLILADDLIAVAAAVMATGPLIAIASLRRGMGAERRNQWLGVMILHALGNALLLLGIFAIYGALGAFDYSSIARQIAGRPASDTQAMVGAVMLIVGITVRSGANWTESFAPLAGAAYVGYRLWPLADQVPLNVRWIVGALAVAWALFSFTGIVSRALGVDAESDAALRWHLFVATARRRLAEYGGYYVRLVVATAQVSQEALDRALHRPVGMAGVFVVGVLAALMIYRRVA
ncbi:MAG: hypothetical protein H6684_04420 [Deltaproteobacteria bacterium]|nr:hypothetical protein [bacterium]MCB9487956.1 hypothetical protein [Deltaproteobacteria bacterium]